MIRRRKLAKDDGSIPPEAPDHVPNEGESPAEFVRREATAAFKQIADEGRPLSQLIAGELVKNPNRMLGTIAKFIPKEVLNSNVAATPLKDISDADLKELVNLVKSATAPGHGHGQPDGDRAQGRPKTPSVPKTDTLH